MSPRHDPQILRKGFRSRRSILGSNRGSEHTKSSSTTPGIVAPVVTPEELPGPRRPYAPIELESIESAPLKKLPLKAFGCLETLCTKLWRSRATEDV